MRYVSLAVTGRPCDSGVTESAAKTVISARAKNSLPRFWTYFSRRYTAAVEAA